MAAADAIRELTAFLTKSDGYQRLSPIETRVQTEIARLADTIAAEVIAENPELRNVITTMVQTTIRAALRDDTYLREVVVKAVAKGIGALVEQREEDND